MAGQEVPHQYLHRALWTGQPEPATGLFVNTAIRVFVAATADRTRVQFDLENDGIFDVVDLDGDGTFDPPTYPADTSYEVEYADRTEGPDPTPATTT